MKTENDALRERIEQLKTDLANEKIRCDELISENSRLEYSNKIMSQIIKAMSEMAKVREMVIKTPAEQS